MHKRSYYFGCLNEPGHYLYSGNAKQRESDLPSDFPVSVNALDGGLLPPRLPQVEGRAELIHSGDWTIISFWNRSVDSRNGSSSTFIIPGSVNFFTAVEIAKKDYPCVWQKIRFGVFRRGHEEETT